MSGNSDGKKSSKGAKRQTVTITESAPDADEQELSLDSLRAAFAVCDQETENDGFFSVASFEESGGGTFESGFARLAEIADSNEENDDEVPLGGGEEDSFYGESEDFCEDPSADEEDDSEEETGDDVSERVEISPRSILEAMLFVGDRDNRPLSPEKAAGFMRNVTAEEILDAAEELNRLYSSNGCPYRIQKEAEGLRMVLRGEFESIRSGFYGKTREARLSQQTLDILAIIAYRQPITADEIQQIRKAVPGGAIQQLLKRELIRLERKDEEGKRRTAFYKTTERFLQLFGLETLDDLPMADGLDFK